MILPFCKSEINEFEFKIENYEKINPEKTIIFSFNNYRVKLDSNIISDDFIVYGIFKGKYCIIQEVNFLDENFFHIMGRKIPENLRTIAGVGVATLNWHNETKFCGKCGKILKFSEKEINAKYCENCNIFFYPRLNPAIIIAVKKGDSLLVTQKPEWKNDRFGLVAGFLEYGESIEQCAIREVYEETGIKIKNVNYITSQFWPFPYQLMIGLEAEHESGEIKMDKTELSVAKWLKRDEFNEKLLPPPTSIARFLMEKFWRG